MTIKTSIVRKLAPFATAAVLLVGFSVGASAYECKATPETATFVSPSAATAMHASRVVWSSKVREKFGLAWSVHSIAASPVQTCTNGAGGTQCVVIAKPCKYVVQ